MGSGHEHGGGGGTPRLPNSASAVLSPKDISPHGFPGTENVQGRIDCVGHDSLRASDDLSVKIRVTYSALGNAQHQKNRQRGVNAEQVFDMFTFEPLLGAQTASIASQSILELDGGVKILVDVGWDETFDPRQLAALEK